MKSLTLILLLSFFFIYSKSQDKITSKDGNVYNVKIIKNDSRYLYMYMSGDTTKSIRRIAFDVISNYEHNTKNDLKYFHEDSILYSNYIKEKEFNMLDSNNDNVNSLLDLKINYPAKYYFSKAQNQFITSTVCSFLGIVVVSIIANNLEVPKDITDPNYIKDLDDYVSSLKTLRNVQYGLLGASAIFTISAGNNFFNGFLELDKLKKQ